VAVDLLAQREVWFSRGSLFDAIRASIAIPTVLRPHHYEGRTLVDGGLLNPVPITPTLRDLTDCTIAVDINAPAETNGDVPGATPVVASAPPEEPCIDVTFGSVAAALAAAEGAPVADAPESERPLAAAADGEAQGMRQRIVEFINGLIEKREKRMVEPGMLELFARSLDVVQETITRFKLAAQPPDLIIRVPRNVGAFYEFHRATEIIEVGRQRTREALRHWQPPKART
jgi:NTE family protein